MIRVFKITIALLIALLPSFLKIPLYRRVCGYRIGKRVKIGLSPFIHVARCTIADDARIGHCNLFYRVSELNIGEHVSIGFLNLFRGGDSIKIGPYAQFLRMNVINSIPEPDVVNPTTPVFEIGTGGVVTTQHWLDFTDRITIGAHTIIGGRNSSFWTHNRQRTRAITIGSHCYIGSEVRVAPGVGVPSFCIVGLGSVLTGEYPSERCLIGGNPGRIVRLLKDEELFLITRKTRNIIPDEIVNRTLPVDLRGSSNVSAEVKAIPKNNRKRNRRKPPRSAGNGIAH